MLTLIREGDMSTAVYALQKRLTELGYNGVVADGRFGPMTTKAVIGYQSRNGLLSDGIVGTATMTSLGLSFPPRVLSDNDYENAAKRIGCDVKIIKAFKEVEAAGSGFMSDGLPLILFERHYFYRQYLLWPKSGQSSESRKNERQKIMDSGNRDICWPSPLSTKSTFPIYDRYGPSSWQYPRLTRARQFSDTAALESASWGLFQVMGENWSRIGWSSVQAFHRAMCTSERDQLDAFVGFCFSKHGLVDALRRRDFNTIASLYNGTGAVGVYGPKLQRAYNRA